MKIKLFILIFPVILFILSGFSEAKPVVSFGYMNNIENSRELSYLEFILPNSFANSVSAVFDVNVKKPLAIEKELGAKKKSLKKNYEFYELNELMDDIKTDIFVFGNFEPLPKNQIKIMLNIYIKGYSEIFTFTNVGKMETQVSRIMDRISIIIINFMSEKNLYKVRNIPPGSSVAILSNLEQADQNNLLMTFMRRGYHVLCFQNNDLRNIVNDETINKFSYIRTAQNSFDVITDYRQTEFYHGTWTGKKYQDSVSYIKYLFRKYDLRYDLVKEDTLDRLNNAYDNRIDVLLIIGFSSNKSTSWVRAIDMKEKELIWMQSNIKSDFLSGDKITACAGKILEYMITEPANPFIKQNKPAGEK